MSAQDQSISLTEAAEELGVHYMTVYRHVRTGRLPATRLPAGWEIDRRDLELYRGQSATVPMDARQRQIEQRLVEGDDAGIWTFVESALASAMPAQAVLQDLLIPAMQSIGSRWESGSLTVLEEHRASSAMTVVLSRLGPHIGRIEQDRGSVIVGTPAFDTHALAATMLADLLRTHGFPVIELGAATPPASFSEQVGTSKPVAVVVSVSQMTDDLPTTLRETVAAIRAVQPSTFIALGGPGITHLPADVSDADVMHNDINRLVGELLQLEVPSK